MPRSCQALRARNHDFEGCKTAMRVVARDQEAYPQWSETDGLLGGIDIEINIRNLLHSIGPPGPEELYHVHLPW
jgi:hypothetical protein